jgi:hypothetical protein
VTALLRKRFVELCSQLDEVEATKRDEWNEYARSSVTRVDSNSLLNWKVKAKSLLQSVCGADSQHFKMFEENETGSYLTSYEILKQLRAVFLAAREDFEGGYLLPIRRLVQAEVFDSELEQAAALLSNGYKTAAAVVAGIVLETALRELCGTNGIAVGKLDKMNADLAKAQIYSVLIQKRITALAEIRNSAAHGHPEKFNEDDVASMIKDVERFLREFLA